MWIVGPLVCAPQSPLGCPCQINTIEVTTLEVTPTINILNREQIEDSNSLLPQTQMKHPFASFCYQATKASRGRPGGSFMAPAISWNTTDDSTCCNDLLIRSRNDWQFESNKGIVPWASEKVSAISTVNTNDSHGSIILIAMIYKRFWNQNGSTTCNYSLNTEQNNAMEQEKHTMCVFATWFHLGKKTSLQTVF